MATYTCKFCGYQNSNAQSLTSSYCNKSPHKQHELMNATEKLSQYVCKYCGYTNSNPTSLCSSYCSKSPHKQHELLG